VTSTDVRAEAVAAFPDEVVTYAHVQYLTLPGLAGEFALITLDNGFDHTKPTTFGPQSLININQALDEVFAHTPAVSAVGVTGKPFIFSVGADLKAVGVARGRDDALTLGRFGHQVFRRLRDSEIPTFAFVNGAAMGGGLEIALACHYRTLSSGAAVIALPECFLGLLPGWGGCTLLPNIIGPDNAVKVIVENPLNQNRMLKAPQAFDLGIADAMFDSADYLEKSLQWAVDVLNGDVKVERPDFDRGSGWDEAVARGKAIADSKTFGEAPAPYRALEIIDMARTGLTPEGLTAGFAAEDEALADLVMSEQLRAGLYAFDLVQKRARRPVGAPDKGLARKVTKVGVVGAGLMASQLALLFARRLDVPVVMTDLDQARLDKGIAYCHAEIDKDLQKGKIGQRKANRQKSIITGSLTKDAFSDASFVIEAVFEDMKVKKQVFAEVEEHVSEECVLATNTSSLSVSEMAADLQHPERVVGFHFFNPVAILPLLEVVKADQTDDATLATAFSVAKSIKKSAVLCADRPAFVLNRIFARLIGTTLQAFDEGTPAKVLDDALEPPMPMPLFGFLGLVGLPVAMHAAETMNAAFPDRFPISDNAKRVVAEGKANMVTWGADGVAIDPELAEVLEIGDNPLTREELRTKALEALADEIRIMLDEGVCAGVEDIDMATILGGGWPFFYGGITPYLDREGISERVNGKRFLPKGVASLP